MLEIFSSKKRVWRAVRKGTVMAFANASIIMLIATVADALRSVWTIVAIMVASLLAYFAAYQEARFDDEQDAWEAQQKAHAEAAGERTIRMTRKDVALALTISVAALLLYVGVKQVLGGHWDWVTFVIWVLGALLFGFGMVYAKSFLMRLVDEMNEDGVAPETQRKRQPSNGGEGSTNSDSAPEAGKTTNEHPGTDRNGA